MFMSKNHAYFTIIYDGPALKGSQMDVRELAPALLAIGDVLEQANRAINGDKANVKIHVKAFKKGCFGVDFELIQTLCETVKGWLLPESRVRNAVELLNLLGFTPREIIAGSAIGLFALIKKFKGKRPKKIKKAKDEKIELIFDTPHGEESITINKEEAILYEDPSVRASIEKSVSAVRHEGIETMEIEQGGRREILVTKADVNDFNVSHAEADEIQLGTATQQRVLSIVSLSFKKDNKWRLSDGNAVMNVKISDPRFLEEVNKGSPFSKGDMLEVDLTLKSEITKDGLKTEYEATRVLRHIRRFQLTLSDIAPRDSEAAEDD